MKLTARHTFQGDPQHRPKNAHPLSPKRQEPYIADRELIQAVNLAIYLRRPLLLEGEAGCGKTRLASAVAYELGLPLYRWDIRSTTKAQEGLYIYDAILRLHDVEVQKGGVPPARNPSNPTEYIEFGALGEAFQLEDCPAVVLIDEIDKADLDFPNDLLGVLDKPWKFKINETSAEIEAKQQPIVIITSNKEKGNLPAPFLRRCVYYFIKFPDTTSRLQEIVRAHYEVQEAQLETTQPGNKLVEAAADRFLEVRKAGGLFKNPGTSEFLDWIEALQNFDAKPYPVSKLKSSDPIPYRELLFKLRADWQKYATAS